MKKILITILSLATLVALAQAPQNISYQGIARQSGGAILSNQSIGVEIKIYQNSASGTLVYDETHNTITTNSFGLFSLFIGGGTPVVGTFSSINWSTGIYFVETLIDPAGGSSYSSVGAQQLMSVPYALYAETSGNASASPTININAPNTISNPSTGVYNISVPSYSAGTGISISSGIISNTGSTGSSTITGSGLAVVTPSVGNNFTINVTPQTLSVGSGSLSISGGNSIALPASQVLSISANTITLSGGGGAITLPTQTLSLTGNTLTSGVASNSVNLALLPSVWTKSLTNIYQTTLTDLVGIGTTTPNSPLQVKDYISFEHLSGANTSLGYLTGTGITPNNYRNTFVGHQAGTAVGTGTASNNTFIGYSSGSSTSNSFANTFLGAQAGLANTTGSSNTYIGANAATSNTTGGNNLFVGSSAGFNNTTGNNNAFLGTNAAASNTTGGNNLFVGSSAGFNNTTGYNNTFLGTNADLQTPTQRTNATAIGYNAKVDTNNAIVLGGLFANSVNVGIGTTKPESSFHVTNSNGSQIKFGHNNQPKLEWFFDVDGASHLGLRNENNGTTNNIMDFDPISGRVGVGVTSPGYRLSVNGNVSDDIATLYATNNSTNTTIASHGVYGLTNNTFSLSAGVFGNNTSIGPSIYGSKTAAQTGIAGRFELLNTSNSADAIFAMTQGAGAAIHAATSGSNAFSQLALLLENGHVKSTQVSPPLVSTASVAGGVISATYTLTNGTDVKGSLLAVITTTGVINSSGSLTIKVAFNRSYTAGSTPIVVITPTSDYGMLTLTNGFISYFVSGVNNSQFLVTLKNNTNQNISGNGLSYGFNYFVIE